MRKETLTNENIKEDLQRAEKLRRTMYHAERDAYMIPLTGIALIIGFFFKNVILALPFAAVAIYHVVRLIIELRALDGRKKAIMNGDFTVSSDILSHISTETVYEPRLTLGANKGIKEVDVLYFGGGSWRPMSCKRTYPNFKHYKWSNDFKMTTDGLVNTSVKGNGFYVVIFEGEIVYAYNEKFFEYKE